jgi:PAS domain S-box-containing protein
MLNSKVVKNHLHSPIKKQNVFLKQAEILDLANDTIMIRDLDDRIVYWNQGAERLYGWSRKEAIGSYVHTFLKTTFPKSLQEIFREFLSTGHWDGQLEHSKKDGSRIIVASRWTLQRNETGEPSAYLEINNDITERKRSEIELKKAHDLLEKRVEERTSELLEANKRLRAQIAEREKTEQALKALSARFIVAQEQERRRISRDLHDDLGQILTLMNLDLERALRIGSSVRKAALIRGVLQTNQ